MTSEAWVWSFCRFILLSDESPLNLMQLEIMEAILLLIFIILSVILLLINPQEMFNIHAEGCLNKLIVEMTYTHKLV
jgi:hypothetical protein